MGLAHFKVQILTPTQKHSPPLYVCTNILFTTPPTPSTLTPSTPHTPSTLTQVYCGGYINHHMLAHKVGRDHNVVLSLADLSVWCFTCDSYLDNQVDTLSPPPLSWLRSSLSIWCDELQLKHLRKPSSHRVVAMVIYTSGRDSGYERFTLWCCHTH